MIEPVKGLRGQEQALCKCHDCAAETVVAASHGDNGPFQPAKNRNGFRKVSLRNEGQVITKLQAQGWSFVKGTLRCPRCEEKRKQSTPLFDVRAALAEIEKERPMAENVTQLRQPTPKQKREIISILELVYDDDAKRYKGKDTDVTVAETVGGGVLFGWVAEIREQLFGPDGGNEELEHIKAELAAHIKAAESHAADMSKALQAFNAERTKMAALQQRLDAWNKTVGPKAVRA